MVEQLAEKSKIRSNSCFSFLSFSNVFSATKQRWKCRKWKCKNREGAYPICFWRVSSAVENGDEGLKLRSCTWFAAWLFCTKWNLRNTHLLSLRLFSQKSKREKQKENNKKQKTLPEHRERSWRREWPRQWMRSDENSFFFLLFFQGLFVLTASVLCTGKYINQTYIHSTH